MIKVQRDYENEWTVWNKATGEAVIIVKGHEHGYLGNNSFYRIDRNGVTVATCIKHFATAKAQATKLVK